MDELPIAASRSFKTKLHLRQGDLSTPDFSGHTTPISTTPTALMRSGTLSDAIRFSPEIRRKIITRLPNSDKKAAPEKRLYLKTKQPDAFLNGTFKHKLKVPSKPTASTKHAEPRASPKVDNEKILDLTKKLAESRGHYKALEKKYNELKTRPLGLEASLRTESLLDRPATTDLYAELRASPRSIDHSENSVIKELLGAILDEVRDVKARVGRLEDHILLGQKTLG